MDKKNLTVRGTSSQGLFGATLGFFFGFGSVALFGPTANLLKDLMGLSPLQVGFLVSAPALSGSLLRIPFAAWVDTTGGRKPFLVLLVLSVLGMFGLLSVILTCYPDRMTSEIYPLLLIFGVLCGCGIATFSVGIGQVSYWFPQKEQGTALGSFAGYGNLAPGLFTFLLPIALSSLGLAGSYFVWLIFLMIGVVLYFKFGLNAWYFQFIEKGFSKEKARETAQRKYGQEIFPQGKMVDSLTISARCWKTWGLVFIYFTTFGGFIALTAWFPIYWKAVFNVSVFKASLFAAIFSISSSLIRVWGGKVSDRMSGEKTAIFSLFLLFASSIGMTISSTMVFSFFAMLLLGLSMGVANAAVFKLVPQAVPQAIGGAAGWIGGLGAFGGFVIPPLMGVIVGAKGISGYSQGFSVFVILSSLSLCVVFLLKGKN